MCGLESLLACSRQMLNFPLENFSQQFQNLKTYLLMDVVPVISF